MNIRPSFEKNWSFQLQMYLKTPTFHHILNIFGVIFKIFIDFLISPI